MPLTGLAPPLGLPAVPVGLVVAAGPALPAGLHSPGPRPLAMRTGGLLLLQGIPMGSLGAVVQPVPGHHAVLRKIGEANGFLII